MHWSYVFLALTYRSHVTATVYPKKYAHGFVVLCFVVVMQSFIMNSHEVFIHIHQGCFAGTGAIVRLPQWQWSKPDGYGKISQCITTAKHSKAKTVCIFLGIYCMPIMAYYRQYAEYQGTPPKMRSLLTVSGKHCHSKSFIWMMLCHRSHSDSLNVDFKQINQRIYVKFICDNFALIVIQYYTKDKYLMHLPLVPHI